MARCGGFPELDYASSPGVANSEVFEAVDQATNPVFREDMRHCFETETRSEAWLIPVLERILERTLTLLCNSIPDQHFSNPIGQPLSNCFPSLR